ncbi:hypothetical protein BKA70DRAFT_1240996 [Coprinopsis sp. MPI-PUGE-AT-0042]|nr:hypothetical protein BKA70DRAFT_1240996 [Coprinopsis sp. MPI-PUGE-AT-0042]
MSIKQARAMSRRLDTPDVRGNLSIASVQPTLRIRVTLDGRRRSMGYEQEGAATLEKLCNAPSTEKFCLKAIGQAEAHHDHATAERKASQSAVRTRRPKYVVDERQRREAPFTYQRGSPVQERRWVRKNDQGIPLARFVGKHEMQGIVNKPRLSAHWPVLPMPLQRSRCTSTSGVEKRAGISFITLALERYWQGADEGTVLVLRDEPPSYTSTRGWGSGTSQRIARRSRDFLTVALGSFAESSRGVSPGAKKRTVVAYECGRIETTAGRWTASGRGTSGYHGAYVVSRRLSSRKEANSVIQRNEAIRGRLERPHGVYGSRLEVESYPGKRRDKTWRLSAQDTWHLARGLFAVVRTPTGSLDEERRMTLLFFGLYSGNTKDTKGNPEQELVNHAAVGRDRMMVEMLKRRCLRVIAGPKPFRRSGMDVMILLWPKNSTFSAILSTDPLRLNRLTLRGFEGMLRHTTTSFRDPER